MTAAVAAIQHLKGSLARLLSSAWNCELFVTNHLYRSLDTLQYFVCLGHATWAALVLGLEAVRMVGFNTYFFFSRSKAPRLLVIPDSNVYEAIPSETLAPSMVGELLQSMVNSGTALQKSGEPENVIKHCVLSQTGLDMKTLQNTCRKLNVQPVKLPGQTSLTKESWATGLVRHLFPDECPETQASLISGLVGITHSKKEKVLDKDVIELLPHEDRKLFAELSEEKADQASGYSRGGAVNFTPPVLKELVPGHGAVPKIYLCRTQSSRVYAAYYYGKCCSRHWGGPVAVRTEKDALEICINWLWYKHLEAGGAGQRPIKENICAKVDEINGVVHALKHDARF